MSSRLAFTTFNLLNLNEPGLRMYRNARGWDAETHARKIAWTARLLQEMRADVFGFQELWHARSLDRVLRAADMDRDYVPLVPAALDGDGIVCAAALRRSILSGGPDWIVEFPPDFILRSGGDDPQTSAVAVSVSRFSRPVLRFEITPRLDAEPITVYVCHFKSNLPTEVRREGWYDRDTHSRHAEAIGAAISTIRRTAEATALRMIVTEETRGTARPVLVLGDCNDGQRSNTLAILTGDPRFLTGMSDGGGDTDLYAAQTLQQLRTVTDVYYTHVHEGMRQSLDHILVSREFYDRSRKRIWAFEGLEIANDHLNSDDHDVSGTGDHGIVRARFRYRPA
jgi:endonuclease/exonuclease/phosphatase family metal-dependent hydrolase